MLGRRRRHGLPFTSLTAVSLGVLALTLLPSSAAANAAPVSLLVQPWSHFDTGRVNVVYPSALPVVELVQDANASLSASLGLAGIYEIAPGGLPMPTVVAAAFPTTAAAFNGSASAGSAGAAFSMFANLSVYPVNLSLWAPGVALGPTAGPVGSATLSVLFSPTSAGTSTAGVSMNWSVSGWPWRSAGDLLAVAFDLGYASQNSLIACESPPLSLGLPSCTGEGVGSSQGLWGSRFTSLESNGGTGPVAVVSWSSSVLFGGSAAAVTMGALATNPGAGELLLMSPNAGAGPAGSTLSFSLIAPPAAAVASVLRADPVVYAISAASLAAAAAAGVGLYRRADRRLREAL